MRILAAPPGNLALMCCHGQPPVHGIDAHIMIRECFTAEMPFLSPEGVVTSSSSVSLTTSHPCDALVFFPISDSGPQQNSINTRSQGELAGEAGCPAPTFELGLGAGCPAACPHVLFTVT